MKGAVRSNNQSRKQVTPEVTKVKGRESVNNCGPPRFGNTVAKPEGAHPAVGKPVRGPVTSTPVYPSRKSSKFGYAASVVNEVSPGRGSGRVGSPARSQTPKLERHFSFEEEEGVMVTSVRSPGVPTARERPVKPARKNLPKVGTPVGSPPALKRRLSVTPGDGINAIFSPAAPGGSPGAVRRPTGRVANANAAHGGVLPSDKVKRGNAAVGKRGNATRGSGDVTQAVGCVTRGVEGDDDVASVLGSVPNCAQDGRAASSELPHCDRPPPTGSGANESGSSAASPDSAKSQVLCFPPEDAGLSLAKIGVEPSPELKIFEEGDQEFPEDNRDHTRTGREITESDRRRPNVHGVTRTRPNVPEVSPTRPNVPEISGTRAEAPEVTRMVPNLPEDPKNTTEDANSEYSRLISQDSGYSFSQTFSLDHTRTMLLEADSALSCLSRGRTNDARCCQIPSFHSEFGDVSEDIGLERLCDRGQRSPDPSPGYREADSYLLNNGGRFNLVGEFGDVSDDLGAGRFPSFGPRSRGSSVSSTGGHSHGLYEAPPEDGVVHRRGQGPQEAEGPQGALDFPGLSADSGLDDEDMYEYDEDFAEAAGANLDEELILEVLCANRVNQMTRTYNDIEAVSRLLEEKEKDLELTARIGKELLDQNQGLKVRLAALEVEIRTAHEENTQLKHELQQKTQLLHALTSDEDGSPLDHASPLVSPSCGSLPPIPQGLAGGRPSARAGIELLKRRIAWLEDENKSLRMEASQLARDTQRVEEEEAKLVEGVTQQLASVSEESRLLSEELERVRSEGGRQRDEVDALVGRLDAAQVDNKRLRHENEELSSLVMITKENQDRLTTELADFKERYGEVMCLLTEAQENLRKVRQKELPSALAGSRYLAPPITTHHSLQGRYGDSIALEIESSLNYGLSLDSGIHMSTEVSPKAPHYRKVFETVRSASRGSTGSPSPSPSHQHHHQRHPSVGSTTSFHGNSAFAQLSTSAMLSSASSSQACRMSTRASTNATQQQQQAQHAGYGMRGSSFSSETPRHLYGALPSTGFHSLDSMGQSEESDQSEMTTDSEDCLYPGPVRDGIPGSPGAKELQAALARIAKQQTTMIPPLTKGEKAIGGYEGKGREPSLDAGSLPRWSLSLSTSTQHQPLPYGCRTPDSIMSTGSSRGSTRSTWRMPEKLQIVKPLEGSLTLGWWSRLATPSLSAALEERPGVKVRGGGDCATQHTLLDLEEDDDSILASSSKEVPLHPGKFFQGTGSVYTYTNSTVLHPDNTVPPSPMPQSPVTSSPSQPTPLLSRRSSMSTATPTFSTALGLAKMLRERGISASSSTEDLQQAGGHFTSATATPCNSPDGTPTRSPSPEMQEDEDDDTNPITSLISSGAELLRRSLAGSLAPIPPRAALGCGKRLGRPPLSRSDRKALVGMKLVEKLERIGLESIMANPMHRPLVPLTTALQVGTMYSRPAVKSPMAQLTSLKATLRSRSLDGLESGSESSTVGHEVASQRRCRRPLPKRRRDLGTVPAKEKEKSTSGATHVATRGTISAIFFGRKGGLM